MITCMITSKHYYLSSWIKLRPFSFLKLALTFDILYFVTLILTMWNFYDPVAKQLDQDL